MAYERREFAGAAATTDLASGINAGATTITITDATNWPDGSSGDFFVVIDPGTASEEKVRLSDRTSTTLTVAGGGRGADGTSAVSHNTGAVIRPCITAVDFDEANAHIADTGLDHHTQYLNTTRHDVEARHTFGGAYGTPAAPADVGTTAAAGSGNNPAREDHVHQIGSGAIDDIAMITAGVRAGLVPATSPLGWVAQAAASGQTLSDGNEADITGATVTFTAGTNRKYKITAIVTVANSSANDMQVKIKRGSTTIRTLNQRLASTNVYYITGTAFDAPSAGSVTYKLTVQAQSGAIVNSDGGTIPNIIVEDIGGT